jgi:hypothetical protein
MQKTGRRIWYAIAIFLSGVILLVSAMGIAGVWITQRALANTIVQVLDAVGNVTTSLRQAAEGVDTKLEHMQGTASYISTVASTLGENINDQGLIKQLLPPDQEQNLVAVASSVTETISTLRDGISTGITLYRSIDQLPFVSLPSPTQDQINKLEDSIGAVQTALNNLVADITAFRSSVSSPINRIGAGADNLNNRLGQARDSLAQLDARLAITLERLDSLKQTAVRVLLLLSVLITLLMAWVIYSQVELIRLYVQRWKAAGVKPENIESAGMSDAAEDSDAVKNGPPPPDNTGEGQSTGQV